MDELDALLAQQSTRVDSPITSTGSFRSGESFSRLLARRLYTISIESQSAWEFKYITSNFTFIT